ncbi:hypothetical protein T484DRAFT_3201845 [Baffinella frigidus]|nr:hypothetical protein T484DRAFT_3201845 [Cryptophyta sp. CCMP2293]
MTMTPQAAWRRRSGVAAFSALSALAVLIATPVDSGASVPCTPWVWPRDLGLLGQGLRLRGGSNRFGHDVNMGVPPKPTEIGEDLTENGGVLKTVLETGWRTPRFSIGDEVSVAVIGKVPGVVFMNRTESDPLVFRWGRGEVVQGIEIAIASMKLNERAGFLVRSDYGYGDDPPYAGLRPSATVQFEIRLMGIGERDLSEGRGGVLLTVLQHGDGWEEPSPLDEVQVSIEGRTPDGALFADSKGPVWLDLASGLLPRGLALAIANIQVGTCAQAVLSDGWIFSDRQLTACAEDVFGDGEARLEPSNFFRPNLTAWVSPTQQHAFGSEALRTRGGAKRGGTYNYMVTLHNYHRVTDVLPGGKLQVKLVDQGMQESYLSDIEDGALADLDIKGWIAKDGFRNASELFYEAESEKVRVGSGDVPRALDLALPRMHPGQRAVLRVHPSFLRQGVAEHSALDQASLPSNCSDGDAADAEGAEGVDADGGVAATPDAGSAAATPDGGSRPEAVASGAQPEAVAGRGEVADGAPGGDQVMDDTHGDQEGEVPDDGRAAGGRGGERGEGLWIPRGVPVEVEVNVRGVTHVKDLDPAQRLAQGELRKLSGNAFFKQGRFSEAATRYERAAAILEGGMRHTRQTLETEGQAGNSTSSPQHFLTTAEEKAGGGDGVKGEGGELAGDMRELQVQVFCNLAASQMRLERHAPYTLNPEP